MDNNKIIKKEDVILNIPPDKDKLLKMNYEELKEHTLKLNIPRETIESIKDEDKGKIFMINECLRLQPPFPQLIKPVIISEENELDTMKKKITGRYVKHIKGKDNKYSHSEITIESYFENLQQVDISRENKRILLKSIDDEVSNLDLTNYNSKESIMEFACNNGKSNGEKRRRAIALQRKLITEGYNRHRITHHEISVY
tara:strand:+ start:687 stop:1283 length:597 start_codon:yes stop_codon:yes gene_type:complete